VVECSEGVGEVDVSDEVCLLRWVAILILSSL